MLERAVGSVLQQSFPPSEIIIVDDASTDDTAEYVNELKRTISSVIYIRNEKCEGAQSSRNKALNIATGTYITGLDDDDEYLPNRLEKLYLAFINDSNLSFVCDHIKIDTGISSVYPNRYVGKISTERALDFNIMGPQVFTKTEYLVAIGGFDVSFPAWQDYDTWIRLIDKFGQCRKLSGYSYIQHTAHDKGRISTAGKHQQALKLFLLKHSNKMSRGNKLSLLALSTMLSGRKNKISTIIYLIISGKLKRAVSVLKSNILNGRKI
ncbi:Chondroitin synthase [Vibrio cholerae]|nr:Chondroitin synthase [Vibrio cholerae]